MLHVWQLLSLCLKLSSVSDATSAAIVCLCLKFSSDIDTACVATKVGFVQNCRVILMMILWAMLFLCLKLPSDNDAACVANALSVLKIVQ